MRAFASNLDTQLQQYCLSVLNFVCQALTPRVIPSVAARSAFLSLIVLSLQVAIRLVLHNTSICFICAHFTAGQNEFNERNKDYKSIMEKLSFQPVGITSRVCCRLLNWHSLAIASPLARSYLFLG